MAGSKDGAATQKHVANNIFADSFKSRFTVVNGKNPVEVFSRLDKLSKEPQITLAFRFTLQCEITETFK